ncbi:MAG: O-antigen ligase family protein, partial [Gammaproteobacteria bacterium]|nr:O-antigen ligase family protein [Gammaproteobacteria bacterium]
GVGGGNYQWVFSGYRSESLRPLVYDHAHNDYLELLAEYGIMGSALFAIAMLYAINIIINGYMQCRDRRLRGLVLGALLGILSFLIHGLVDFNFHIPANAAYFYALIGIAMSASCCNEKEPNDLTKRRSSHA